MTLADNRARDGVLHRDRGGVDRRFWHTYADPIGEIPQINVIRVRELLAAVARRLGRHRPCFRGRHPTIPWRAPSRVHLQLTPLAGAQPWGTLALLEAIQEHAQHAREGLGGLQAGQVARTGQDLEPGAGDRLRHGLGEFIAAPLKR